MTEETKHIELFEAYLSNNIPEKDVLKFEARLSYDAEFRKEFEQFRAIEEGIRKHFRNEMKSNLSEIDIELDSRKLSTIKPKWSKLRKLYFISSSVAASLILGLIVYYSNLGGTSGYETLVAENMPIEYGIPVKMSTKGKYDDAMNSFKLKNWNDAKKKLEQIKSDTSDYFLGVIAIEVKNYKTSIDYFKSIPTNSSWHEEAEFRLALAYLLENKLELAKEVLLDISKQDGIYSLNSKEILERL